MWSRNSSVMDLWQQPQNTCTCGPMMDLRVSFQPSPKRGNQPHEPGEHAMNREFDSGYVLDRDGRKTMEPTNRATA